MKLSADHRIKDVVEFILSSFGSRFHIGAVGDDILEHFLDNTLRGQIAGLCAGAVLKADGMAFINGSLDHIHAVGVCLEALASATALIRMTKEARLAHPESALNVLAAKLEDVNGRTAFDAAAQGDAAAQQVVDTYIHYLAVGIANLINIFFPEVIGLSGGVANQGENLLKPLRAAVEPMVFGHDFAKKHTRITTCTLGYRAGVIGAALLAKSRME